MPIVITSMGIFPNVFLTDLVYHYDYTSKQDIYTTLMNIISPNPVTIYKIAISNFRYDITIQFSLYVIFGVLIIIALMRAAALSTVISGITAFLIVPFTVDVGMVIWRSAGAYRSTTLNLMIFSILIAMLAFAILSILEIAKSTDQEVSD